MNEPKVESVDSANALKTLKNSEANGHFWKYLRYYETQETRKTCALASAVMVLNSLDIEAPLVREYYPINLFTQRNILNKKASEVHSFNAIEIDGASLDHLGKMLEAGWPVMVDTYYASELKPDEFRELLLSSLNKDSDRVIINFRTDFFKSGIKVGHFSPVTAYNRSTDEFLVMDVARYFTGPYWVDAKQLFKAVQTVDSSSGKSRGILVIRARDSR